MKITNNGKYAKRINQLIKSFKLYFNITDDNIIIESVNNSINLINYFNSNKIYFYKHSYDKIECDIHKCNFGCGNYAELCLMYIKKIKQSYLMIIVYYNFRQ